MGRSYFYGQQDDKSSFVSCSLLSNRITVINCSSKYTRVMINLIVQCLNPWVLKWKNVLWVELRALSNPGVILY